MIQEEVKQIIIDNHMTYSNFVSYFNVAFDDAIKIFQHLDLKKCSAGKNCANSNGPIQSRKNFGNSKSARDRLQSQCTYCKKQVNYRNYQDNKEDCKQRAQQYHQKNKEYYNQKDRQYYRNNKEHFNQKTKEYDNSYAKFDRFNIRISYAEKTRHDLNNSDLIQVKCAYCNQWFNPINRQVRARIDALEGRNSLGAENRFYCSEECKEACPIYRQKEHLKDDPRNLNNLGTSREVQSELRQLVFERDNWTCQRCFTYKDELDNGVSLHCHHVEGIRHEPIESADTDMCMTVCNECHKEIHQIPGCRYQDMQCKVEEEI